MECKDVNDQKKCIDFDGACDKSNKKYKFKYEIKSFVKQYSRFAKIKCYGQENSYYFMVMDLLGPSLADLF